MPTTTTTTTKYEVGQVVWTIEDPKNGILAFPKQDTIEDFDQVNRVLLKNLNYLDGYYSSAKATFENLVRVESIFFTFEEAWRPCSNTTLSP